VPTAANGSDKYREPLELENGMNSFYNFEISPYNDRQIEFYKYNEIINTVI